MARNRSLRKRLREKLKDPEYRHAYADEALNLFLASQIRVLREQRRLSQAALAEKVGTKQAGVSRYESANYAGWTIKNLKKLAEAFDLRLRVSFEPFGTLWYEVATRRDKHLERPTFKNDPEFSPQDGRTETAVLAFPNFSQLATNTDSVERSDRFQELSPINRARIATKHITSATTLGEQKHGRTSQVAG